MGRFTSAHLIALLVVIAATDAFGGDQRAGATTKDTTMISNLYYAKEHDAEHTLDLFLPENATGAPLPVIVLIHGGGWSGGDKEGFAGTAKDLAKRGYAVASINYRLKNNLFPAPVVDCKAAVRWLRAQAGQYKLDPKRFVVCGHSAGGHLAAFLAVTNGVREFDQGEHLDSSSDVSAAIWFAGVGDFVTRVLTPGFESEAAADSGESRLIGGPVLQNKDKALAASPIHYVSKDSAPIILFHGDTDELVPVSQAIEMYVALDRRGVQTELHILKGADHGGNGQYQSSATYQRIDAFLNRVFAPK